MAAAAACFFIFTAGIAVGATNAFAAFFLLAIDIKSCKADDYGNDGNDDNIFHTVFPFFLIMLFWLFLF